MKLLNHTKIITMLDDGRKREIDAKVKEIMNQVKLDLEKL